MREGNLKNIKISKIKKAKTVSLRGLFCNNKKETEPLIQACSHSCAREAFLFCMRWLQKWLSTVSIQLQRWLSTVSIQLPFQITTSEPIKIFPSFVRIHAN